MSLSERGELTRLRREVMRSRLAVSAMRQDLIEALGDWLCGSGVPPGLDAIEAFTCLCEARDAAEARYASFLALRCEDVVARAQRGGTMPEHERP